MVTTLIGESKIIYINSGNKRVRALHRHICQSGINYRNKETQEGMIIETLDHRNEFLVLYIVTSKVHCSAMPIFNIPIKLYPNIQSMKNSLDFDIVFTTGKMMSLEKRKCPFIMQKNRRTDEDQNYKYR